MEISIYQVDAFTSRLFGGNPAAVCPLAEWLPDETMRCIAAENNLAETAFFVPQGEGYHLRWFTATVEVDLCGHATLAAAFVIFQFLQPEKRKVTFTCRSGDLAVLRDGARLTLDFPAKPPAPAEPPAGLIESVGGEPLEALKADYWLLVYGSEAEVRALEPDFPRLAALTPGTALCASAPGDEVDFVYRFFAPAFGIPEDPATGSAQCMLTPFYSLRHSKPHLHARQISARGGELHCEMNGDRVLISGEAVLYLEGRIRV